MPYETIVRGPSELLLFGLFVSGFGWRGGSVGVNFGICETQIFPSGSYQFVQLNAEACMFTEVTHVLIEPRN